MKKINSFIREVPQLVPESWCLQCRICCRFPANVGVQTPTWSSLETSWISKERQKEIKFQPIPNSPSFSAPLTACGEGYHCPAFKTEKNSCSIYSDRPLDCRLYPFALTTDASQTRVLLAMDTKCPYIQAHGNDPETVRYIQRLTDHLETPEGLQYLKENPKIVGPSWPEFISLSAFPSLTASLQEGNPPPHPILQPLRWADCRLLKEALRLKRHLSSSYTLAALFGWSDLIKFWRVSIDGYLCLFASQAGGLFMPFPPLGISFSEKAVAESWAIMEQANQGNGVSRIEGIEPEEADCWKRFGFHLADTEPEYLYKQDKCAALQGNRYKSQRWAVNRFKKHTSYTIRPFREEDLVSCLQLYTLWGIRKQQSEREDSFAKALIRDGLFFHRRIMMNTQEMGLIGRVIEIDGQIRGYTFWGEISAKIFCIFLEIGDGTITGLAQTLFQESCRELEPCSLINTMGDSGLAGLRQSKQSYQPIQLVSTLIATKGSQD